MASYLSFKEQPNLNQNFTEYKLLLRRIEPINVFETRSIGDNVHATGDPALSANFSILDKAASEFDLLIHESLFIMRDHLSLNLIQNSSIPLYSF